MLEIQHAIPIFKCPKPDIQNLITKIQYPKSIIHEKVSKFQCLKFNVRNSICNI